MRSSKRRTEEPATLPNRDLRYPWASVDSRVRAGRLTALDVGNADPNITEFPDNAADQACAHVLTRLYVSRHDDDDGVARIGQRRIERG